MPVIELKKLHPDVAVPPYATVGTVGCDLIAYNMIELYGPDNSPMVCEDNAVLCYLYPKDKLKVGCGFAIALPKGWLMDIRSRTGNDLKQGYVVAHSSGTIDSTYRDEICVILHNTGIIPIAIQRGDKIAQGIVMQYDVAAFIEVDEFGERPQDRTLTQVTAY